MCNGTLDADLNQLLLSAGSQPLQRLTPVAGGSINRTFQVETANGERFFYKTHRSPPPRLFESEAQGLQALAKSGVIAVPRVVAVNSKGLLLEFIDTTCPESSFWTKLGEQLAALHAEPVPCFGFYTDNYCGATPQANPTTMDGWQFYSEQRLRPLAVAAQQKKRLNNEDIAAIESLCRRLPELIPEQPPALIHGDLWSGNLLCRNNRPVLIDPATYWGWAEADLAMTALFGGFPPAFYHSYQVTAPLIPGWQQRFDIYNLYHLLNHLLLFGSAYLAQVRRVLHRFR